MTCFVFLHFTARALSERWSDSNDHHWLTHFHLITFNKLPLLLNLSQCFINHSLDTKLTKTTPSKCWNSSFLSCYTRMRLCFLQVCVRLHQLTV